MPKLILYGSDHVVMIEDKPTGNAVITVGVRMTDGKKAAWKVKGPVRILESVSSEMAEYLDGLGKDEYWYRDLTPAQHEAAAEFVRSGLTRTGSF